MFRMVKSYNPCKSQETNTKQEGNFDTNPNINETLTPNYEGQNQEQGPKQLTWALKDCSSH